MRSRNNQRFGLVQASLSTTRFGLMDWRDWIVTSHCRVDVRDVDPVGYTRKLARPERPEDYLINAVAFVQPGYKGSASLSSSTVTGKQ